MLGLFFSALFILMNGLFVAAEFAFVKLHALQIYSRVKRGHKKGSAIESILARLDRYLSVTQFGVTLASLGLGWVGEPAVERLVEPIAGRFIEPQLANVVHVVSIVLAFGALTFAHVLLGELVPKLVAIQRSEKTAILAATPLRAIFFAFRPLLWILERASALILRLMGLSADTASEGTVSEEEILGILVANTARSPGGKEKSQLLERVLRFAQRTARHAMVHRVDVASLPIETSGHDAVAFLRAQQFSRIVLTRGRSLDHVAGYLYTKDFLLDPEAEHAKNLSNLRRDVLFVPEGQGLVDVLRDMQHAHTPIAVVVDEYGGTSGIITMEDLLEEIVGEIRDEFDQEPARVTRVLGEEATWDVDARATMEELRTLGIPVREEESAEAVGAVLLERLGRIPRMGDRVVLDDQAGAEVTSVSRRRITRVRVRMSKAVDPLPS